jgi:hemerythrin
MEILGYPGRGPHIDEHKGFIKVIADLERRSITHNDITETEIIEFLRHWLLNHIATSDKDYSHYYSGANNVVKKAVAG